MARPRKPGERYPSGKLKPAPKPNFDPISGVEWQRIRQDGRRLGADPRLASELARLNLFGELTIVQTTAGQRVGEIYGRYERLTGLKRSVRSPSYERAYGIGFERQDAERAAAEAFRDLQDTLDQLAQAPPPIFSKRKGRLECRPHHVIDALEHLCVENRAIGPALYPEIRGLLDYLAATWGLSTIRRPNAGSSRRAPITPAPEQQPRKPEPRTGHDQEAWMKVMRTLRPDLTDAQLENAYRVAQAVRDRGKFLNERPTRTLKGSRVIAFPDAAERTARRLDQPTLTLPGDRDVR